MLFRVFWCFFSASFEAYRSFPRELRAAFPFSQLHLGHLATSFALREAPREVVQKNRRSSKT